MPEPKHRIVIIGLHYSPESTGNAPYTTSLAEGLQSVGHDVKVLTGYPHYPEWKVHRNYSGWSRVETLRGVSLKRLRHTVPASPSFVNRTLMEVSFGLRAMLTPWGKPDVVLLVSPALLSCALVMLRIRLSLNKPKVAVWTQDLYSRGLVETGGGSAAATTLAKAMAAFESLVLSSADGVVAIHERFKTYMVSRLRVRPSRVVVIRNWTHLPPSPSVDRAAVRLDLGWADNEVIALHAGNIGKKQGLENVVEAARLAGNCNSSVKFVVMGDGNQRQRLERLAEGISNISFMDPLPRDQFQQALCAADILLVNELPDVRDMSVPSKMTSYFNASLAVVAATDEGSVTAQELAAAQAGLRVEPGNPEALLQTLEELGANPEARRSMGERGLRFRRDFLSKEQALARYDDFISSLASSRDQ